MRWVRRRLGDPDRGSAVVEFIVIGVLLTLPVFYLVIALARLQAGAYAVTEAAREAARAYVAAPDEGAGAARARAASALAFADQGFAGEGSVTLVCGQSPCLARGGTVAATGDLSVRLPLVPDFLRGVVPDAVHLSSRDVESVDRFAPR